MDLKLILLPLLVLALLAPAIVALIAIPNRFGRTPWQRNLHRLFGVVVGCGLAAAVVAWSDKHPDHISDGAQFFIVFASVTFGIAITTALAGLVTRFLNNRRSS